MNIINAIILGIVEGMTEFLPISSTGHLILFSHVLKIPSTDFLKSFEISIQLGAILSVVVLYWKSLFRDINIVKRVAVAFVPTMVLGFVFYKIIKLFLLGNERVVLWSLFLGGVFLIIFEFFYRKRKEPSNNLAEISYKQAFLIGLFQSIAMIPGISRSAATIIGGLFMGLPRKTIVEFSFLLAVPTMAAATGLDLIQSAGGFSLNYFYILLVGFIASFVVAMMSIKFLLRLIKTHSFFAFGVYRVVLAILFWLIFLSRFSVKY